MAIGKPIICPVLIGRSNHFDQLLQLGRKAGEGQGQVGVVSGEAGIGKSRLLAEVTASLLSRPSRSVSIAQGRCFETDRNIPYAPFLDLLRSFLTQNAHQELLLDEASTASLRKLLPELPGGLPPVAEKLNSRNPEQEKRLLWQALTQVFFQLSTHQPLLVVIEDLHWSDEASLEFLLYFARRLLTRPIFLLLTYRREEVGPALAEFLANCDREHLISETVLTPLNPQQVGQLIEAIFDLTQPVRADFLEAIYQLSEGNPFFIEEVLKSLTLAGDIFYKDERWDRKPLAELQIPRTVQVAVQRRTDRLSQAARQLLTFGAVAGRRFDFSLLQALTGQSEEGLIALIRELMLAQLVVEETADRYAFRHALTQQAVYSDLLARERRALHRQVAETLEHISSSGTRQPSADLLQHYYKGEVWEKTLEYAYRAGEEALELYSPKAAINYYSWGLEAVEQLGRPFPPELYRVRGQAHEMLGEFEAAHQDYNAALEAAYRVQASRSQWQSLLDLGSLWRGRDYERSKKYLESAVRLAREIGEPVLLGQSLNLMGNWILNSAQPLEARRYHREALAIFEQLDDQTGLADTLDFLAVSSLIGGNLIEGASYYEQAITIFRRVNDRPRLVSGLTMLSLRGPTYLTNLLVPATNDLALAAGEAEEALKLAHETSYRSGEALAQSMLTASLVAMGHYSRALELAWNSLQLATELEHSQWICFANWAVGINYLDLLELASARRYFEQALAMARQMGVLFLTHVMLGFVAFTCVAQGELAEAEKLLGQAPGPDSPMLAADSGWLLPLSVLLLAQIELALVRANYTHAADILEKFSAALPNLHPSSAEASSGQVIPHLWHLRARTLAHLGREAEAENLLQAAQAAAQAQGAPSLRWRILLSLGKIQQSMDNTMQAQVTFSEVRALIEELARNIADEALRSYFLANAIRLIPAPPELSPRRVARLSFGGLTERERTVAGLLAQGKSNRIIAEELILSERTIDKHIENIKNKLGFNSRAQIAVWAAEKGLLNILE